MRIKVAKLTGTIETSGLSLYVELVSALCVCMCGVPALITWLHASIFIGALFPRSTDHTVSDTVFPYCVLKVSSVLHLLYAVPTLLWRRKGLNPHALSSETCHHQSECFAGTDEFHLQSIPMGVCCPLQRQRAEIEELKPNLFTNLVAQMVAARIWVLVCGFVFAWCLMFFGFCFIFVRVFWVGGFFWGDAILWCCFSFFFFRLQ